MRTKNLPKSVLHDQSYLIVLKQVIKFAAFVVVVRASRVITQKILDVTIFVKFRRFEGKHATKTKGTNRVAHITSWRNLFFELHISSTEKVVGILFFITRQSNEVKPALGL